MSQMNPYMTNPNAELYALLAQRAANLDRQGGGASAGAGIELDLMNRQAELAALAAGQSDERALRERALTTQSEMDMLKAREESAMRMATKQSELDEMAALNKETRGEARDIRTAQLNEQMLSRGRKEEFDFAQQGRLNEARLNQRVMENTLNLEKRLYLEKQQVEFQLAQSGDVNDPELNALLQQKRAALVDLKRREMAAQKTLAEKDAALKSQLSSREKEISTMREGLITYENGLAGVALAPFIEQYRKDPIRGGIPSGSFLGRVAEESIAPFEFLGEIFTKDQVADTEIGRRLGYNNLTAMGLGTFNESSADMVAAATRAPGTEQLRASADTGFTATGQLIKRFADPSAQINADRYTINLLSELAYQVFNATGQRLDNTGVDALKKVMSEMYAISRNATLSPEEASQKLMTPLQEASTAIFGGDPSQAANSLPRLVAGLKSVFKKASAQAGELTKTIDPAGNITTDTLQTNALIYSLGEGSRLNRVLGLMSGKIFTSEGLGEALGYLEGMVEDESGYLNLGNLPSRGAAARNLQFALQPETAEAVDELRKLTVEARRAKADKSTAETDIELKSETELENLIQKGKREKGSRNLQLIQDLLGRIPPNQEL